MERYLYKKCSGKIFKIYVNERKRMVGRDIRVVITIKYVKNCNKLNSIGLKYIKLNLIVPK